LRITALAVDRQNPDQVVAAAAYTVGSQSANLGIYASQDAGHTWHKLAETSSLVTQLTANRGTVYAATASSLVRYGEAPGPTPESWLLAARSLAHPSGTLVLVLALTVILAGLVLIGRLEWVAGRRTHTA
jgi:hypothetical protein